MGAGLRWAACVWHEVMQDEKKPKAEHEAAITAPHRAIRLGPADRLCLCSAPGAAGAETPPILQPVVLLRLMG